MAVNLATAYIELIPSARGINGAVERQFAPAQGIAEKAGRDSGEAFSSQAEGKIAGAAGRIGSALKGALAIAGAVTGAAGAIGLKTAAQLEQAEISFTTMLGSGEKAQAFLADLSKFAAKTPFDLPGLNKSAGSLISAGIEANKVIPIMTSLGNATSGMGTGAEGVQRATVAIQQMNAAGKIGAEDLNQLRDAGVPVFDLLTAATGKTTAEIADMAAKGKLGRTELEQLMTALETGKGLERFNGLMEAQSQSLTGLVSTFQDTFSVGIAQAIEPLVPLIKTGIGGATAFLADVALPRLEVGLGKTVAVATDAYDILTGADYTGKAANFGIYEDSELVDFLFDLREAGEGVYSIFSRGDFTGPIFGMEEDHAFVDFLFRMREGAIGIRDAVAGLNFTSFDAFLVSLNQAGGEAAPVLADIGGSFKELLPAIVAFGEQAPTIATGGLRLLAAGLSFLAENVDTIIKYMPLIVAGFVAWKVAMIALSAAQAISLPIQVALNVSRIAAARAERNLAGNIASATSALVAHTAATTGSTVATSASAGATSAAAAATGRAGAAARLAAAGQWLLNAALSANPIGIVIVAVGALVAGLVWFFTQTEIGQRIVQAAWAGIQMAVGAVVGWFQTYVAPTVGAVLDKIGAGITWLWTNIFEPVFSFIGGALNAFGMLVGKIAEIVIAVVQYGLGRIFSWLWTDIIQPVVGWISNALELAGIGWNIVFGKVEGFIRNTLAPAFTWLWNHIVQPAMDGIGNAVKWLWDRTLGPVFGTIGDAIEKTLPRAFDLGVAAVKLAWEKLRAIAKAPVEFVIDKVLNKGLIENVNKIARKVGISELPDVAMPEGWMNGGYTGDGPKREVAGPVHRGEWVFTKEQTAALGKHNLARMAHDAVRGGARTAAIGSPAPGEPGWLNPSYIDRIKREGGIRVYPGNTHPFWQLGSAVQAWNGVAGMSSTMHTFGSNGAGMPVWSKSGPGGGQWGANALAYAGGQNMHFNSDWIGRISPSMARATAIHELGHIWGLPHTNKPSIMQAYANGNYANPTSFDIANMQRIYGGTGGVGSEAMVTGGGEDRTGGGLLDLILGPFKDIAKGIIDTIRESFPGAGTFIDLAVGTGEFLLGGLVGFLEDAIGKLQDIASDIWDGVKNLFGGNASMITPTLYDDGGWLQPGLTLARNDSKRPEPIMTGSQWDAFTSGGGDDDGHPPVVAQFYGADMDQSQRIVDDLYYSVQRRRRGGRYARRRSTVGAS